MAGSVRITRDVYHRLLSLARQDPWRECCGLLAGREGVISIVLPAVNALSSPTAFEIAPRELFELFRRMRAEGWDHLGIYHSHPHSENAPSPSDIGQAWYPEAAYFILSPAPDHPHPVRAFRISNGAFTELEVLR